MCEWKVHVLGDLSVIWRCSLKRSGVSSDVRSIRAAVTGFQACIVAGSLYEAVRCERRVLKPPNSVIRLDTPTHDFTLGIN